LKPHPSATGIASAACPFPIGASGIALAPTIKNPEVAASAIQVFILLILRPVELRFA
jgi:hypothetical protein